MSSWRIHFGGASHPGNKRPYNEDNWVTLVRAAEDVPAQHRLPEDCPLDAVFAVADGMGGELNGAAASRAVAETLKNTLSAAALNRLAEQHQADFSDLSFLVRRIVLNINDEVVKTGGGSTLTLLAYRYRIA